MQLNVIFAGKKMDLQRFISTSLVRYLDAFPCVAILGPRQVGKTTTAKQLQSHSTKDTIYLDLESDEDCQKLTNAEQYFDERQDKLIIIDEIQNFHLKILNILSHIKVA